MGPKNIQSLSIGNISLDTDGIKLHQLIFLNSNLLVARRAPKTPKNPEFWKKIGVLLAINLGTTIKIWLFDTPHPSPFPHSPLSPHQHHILYRKNRNNLFVQALELNKWTDFVENNEKLLLLFHYLFVIVWKLNQNFTWLWECYPPPSRINKVPHGEANFM